MNLFHFERLKESSRSSEWNISGSLVQASEIDEEETLCSPQNEAISIFVAHRFLYFNFTDEYEDSLVNAMDTCRKISRSGHNLTEITTKEQFKIWHQQGNNNQVSISF